MKEDFKGNFYKRLLDNASDLIWAIDMEGRFMYINDNISEWGYDKEELIGQPLLNILNTKHIGKRQSAPAGMGIERTFETEILDKFGRAHMVVVSSSPLQDDEGKIIGVMGIIRDVTQTQILEEKLRNEERLASLGRLATGIAHEIRNPLSSIKMNLAILRKRLHPDTDNSQHFDIAQEEVANLERIVTELLDYAKPAPLNLRRHNLHNLIDAAIKALEPVIKEKGIKLKKKLTKKLPVILVDDVKIHQVLLNIILNAIQASEPGSVVEISTKFQKNPPDVVNICIADHGAGIKPEDMTFIYDPFFTTKSDGTGLGLSIVREIMHSHNGEISIESAPEKGTTVSLRLALG